MTVEPQVLHAVPGRLRVHLAGWSGRGGHHIERRLRQVPGVRRVETNPVTRNLLAVYDSAADLHASLLAALGEDVPEGEGPAAAEPPSPPPAVEEEGENGVRRA